jgi:hypothetical protein
MAKFKCLRAAVKNQNFVHEEIKNRLISGNAYYYSVQNPLISRPLSKSLKIKIYKTTCLYVVSYGCETWSLTLSEVHRLRVCEENIWT